MKAHHDPPPISNATNGGSGDPSGSTDRSRWVPFRLLPRAINPHDPPHLSTVARWAFVGVGRPRVRLGTFKCGGKRYSSIELIDEFRAATNGGPVAVPAAVAAEREAAVLQAEYELDAGSVG